MGVWRILERVFRASILAAAMPVMGGQSPFLFEDVGQAAGIFPHVANVRAHAGVFGDVTGNGYPDYFLGNFWIPDTTVNRLFLNQGDGTFKLSRQAPLEQVGRATDGIFVDLNNNGLLDLYVANHSQRGEEPHRNAPNRLFRNEGGGRFVEVGPECGAIPPDFASRAIIPLDYDGDGKIDLLLGGGPLDDARRGLRLFRNLGDFRFEDVGADLGFPDGYSGNSGAVADVTGNGYPDIFFARGRNNALLLNDGNGRYYEAPGLEEVFVAALEGGGQANTGVAFGDLTGNGLPDLVIGQHTTRPWVTPIAPRLLINRGLDDDGHPRFEDVTEAAGIIPVPMKTPHIEIHDFDNDGRADIFFSVVTFDADGRPHPLIFRNEGVRDGIPRFRQYALDVTDFPTEEDRAMRGRTPPFYEKMNRERKIVYAVASPAADFDRDGRMDFFIGEWWEENPSMLLRNVTPAAGNWLLVTVAGREKLNSMGLGARIFAYPSGRLGDAEALIAMREITIGYGYSSGQEAIAHIGLGEHEEVDLRVVLPHRLGQIDRTAVAVNRQITIEGP